MNIFRDGFCCCRRSATEVFIGSPNWSEFLLLCSIRAGLFQTKTRSSSALGTEIQIRVGYELWNRIRCRPLVQISSLAFFFFLVSISFFFSALFSSFAFLSAFFTDPMVPAMLSFFLTHPSTIRSLFSFHLLHLELLWFFRCPCLSTKFFGLVLSLCALFIHLFGV